MDFLVVSVSEGGGRESEKRGENGREAGGWGRRRDSSNRMPVQSREERGGYGSQIQGQKDEALARQHWLQLTVGDAVQETERKFHCAIYYQCTNALSRLRAKLENTTYPTGLL